MRPLSKWHAFPALLALAGCAQPAETDPIYSRSPVAEATAESLEKWNVAYAWGDHAQAGYLTEESDPGFTRSPAATVTADDLVNWRSAHGWGNHAQAGYLTEELDPSFALSPAAGISLADMASWNAAHGWGNHAQAGYLTQETDPTFAASAAAGLTPEKVAAWEQAHAWGDHAAAGYLTSESDPKVGALTEGAVPRWDGSALASGSLVDTGGAVGVGTPQPQGVLDIHSTSVGASTPDVVQDSDNASQSNWHELSQSFTVNTTGRLTRIELWPEFGTLPLLVEVYAGEGATGERLASQSLTLKGSSSWQGVRLLSAPAVVAGQKYTFRLVPLTSDGVASGGSVRVNGNNGAYPGGVLSDEWGPRVGALKFRTFVATPGTSESSLAVGSGVVNIGAVLHLRPRAEPPNPSAGDVYFDEGLKRLRYFNGAGWVSL